MEIKIEKIGEVELGQGDRDQYFCVKRLDDDLSVEEAFDYLMPLFYFDNDSPGQYYCTNMRILPDGPAQVVAIVEHRYNT